MREYLRCGPMLVYIFVYLFVSRDAYMHPMHVSMYVCISYLQRKAVFLNTYKYVF